MIFDDPAYADLPVEVIRKAILAEGLPLHKGYDPIYRFVLFNLEPEAYRIAQPCTVTEHTSARMLWLHHPFLGLEIHIVERIAETIEKVMSHLDELRRYATKGGDAVPIGGSSR